MLAVAATGAHKDPQTLEDQVAEPAVQTEVITKPAHPERQAKAIPAAILQLLLQRSALAAAVELVLLAKLAAARSPVMAGLGPSHLSLAVPSRTPAAAEVAHMLLWAPASEAVAAAALGPTILQQLRQGRRIPAVAVAVAALTATDQYRLPEDPAVLELL